MLYLQYKTQYKIDDKISVDHIDFYAINNATSESDNIENKYNIYCKYIRKILIFCFFFFTFTRNSDIIYLLV